MNFGQVKEHRDGDEVEDSEHVSNVNDYEQFSFLTEFKN